jgi:hypothetical protein
MSNVASLTGNRIVVTLSRQLCSSLLHNWYLVTFLV